MGLMVKSERREIFGKNASRQIRREGKLPAVFYGSNIETVPLTLQKKDILKILKSEAGDNTIFKVTFDSEKKDAMIKEIQTDPVTDEVLHVDLMQIAMDKTIEVEVPVVLVGEAVGVKTEGGFVDFVTREVGIVCLPKNIPEHIDVDISDLHLHQSIKVDELTPPEQVKLISDPSTMIVLIQAPSKEEEVEVEEIEEEEEVIAEGEEPEVIKKEKPEEKEDEKKEEKE